MCHHSFRYHFPRYRSTNNTPHAFVHSPTGRRTQSIQESRAGQKPGTTRVPALAGTLPTASMPPGNSPAVIHSPKCCRALARQTPCLPCPARYTVLPKGSTTPRTCLSRHNTLPSKGLARSPLRLPPANSPAAQDRRPIGWRKARPPPEPRRPTGRQRTPTGVLKNRPPMLGRRRPAAPKYRRPIGRRFLQGRPQASLRHPVGDVAVPPSPHFEPPCRTAK